MPAECPEIRTSNRQTHAHHTLKRAVKELGSRAIDRRTSTGKALDAWRHELIADLGGRDAISSQELAVVDAAVRTKLLLDSVDTWLLQQKGLINHRKRSVYPVVLQRQQLSDALVKYMQTLGLKRRAKPVKTLASLLAEPVGQTAAPTSPAGPAHGDPGSTQGDGQAG